MELHRGVDLLTSDIQLHNSGNSTPLQPALLAPSEGSMSPPPSLPSYSNPAISTTPLDELPTLPTSLPPGFDSDPALSPSGPTPWDSMPPLYFQSHPSLPDQANCANEKMFDFEFDLSVNKGVSDFVTLSPGGQKGTSSGYNSPTSSSSGLDTAQQNSLTLQSSILEDPFDAEWAEIATRNIASRPTSTNPFLTPETNSQSFELQL